MRKRSLITRVVLSASLTSSISFGWYSEMRHGVRDMPFVRQKSFRRAPAPWLPIPGQPEFDSTQVFITNLKDRVGGASAEPGDATTANQFYVCPSTFPSNPSNLANCRIAESYDMESGWSWITARKANDKAPRNEHYLISKAAANMAGLSALTLFQPFWLRYPAKNAYVASPHASTQFLVSQTWQPADNLLSSTQVLRSISLLDLTQLSDSSHSLADWAESNEVCPLPGLEGAFTGSLSENCHDYGIVMGAANATHFAPLNRQSWRYYHFLAKQRMAQCAKLAQLKQPFYTAYNPVVCAPGTPISQCDPSRNDWHQEMHENATEMHECEREAMAYEMIAQHFMQDSWSSGHMWKRWGKANFSEFPSEFAQYSGSADVPQENHAPRRAAIALMTAALAGEVHGVKPVLLSQLYQKKNVPNAIVDYGAWLGLADDPLCGPTYSRPGSEHLVRDVEWRSTTAAPRFPGAGDLFWAPPEDSEEFPPARVSDDAKYGEQRGRLLTCAGASMLEAYNAMPAPHAHGEPVPDPSLADVDPDGEECWDHWATNQAMRASLGAFGYAYSVDAVVHVNNLINSTILENRVSKLAFVKDEQTSLPHYAERRADRVAFLAQLSEQMNRDLAAVQGAYLENERVDPTGVQSALGIDPGGQAITMFGVAGVDTPPPPSGSEPPAPPTDYADQLVKQDASDYAPSDAGLPGNAMSQLFWRGNVERTCRTSLLNNAQELLLLREKCTAKAAGGGNPDACTACVQIAELHVPNLSHGQNIDIPVGDSKCSALGVTPKAQVPAGLPAWWFDNYYRWTGKHPGDVVQHPAEGLDHPAFDIALTWCTGAELRASVGGGLPLGDDMTYAASDNGWLPARDSETSFEPTTTMSCPDGFGGQFSVGYGISHRRHAQAFIEEYNLTSANWVFPIVTALDYTSETRPVGQCGSERIDSRETRFKDSVGGVEIYVSPSKVSHFGGGAAGISAPRCGVRQRLYYWNRPCSTALQNWPYETPAAFNFFFANKRGMEVDQLEYGQDGDSANDYCLLREPRSLVGLCPDGMKCNPDGECNASEQAGAVILLP